MAAMPDVYRMIVRPLVTEKSSAQFGALVEYAFEVHPQATKPEIRAAIEQLFGVRVVGIRTMVQRAKRRTMGKTAGRRPAWKKALVRLREGDSIPVFEG
jgi:large subunit ribosomal protein L23